MHNWCLKQFVGLLIVLFGVVTFAGGCADAVSTTHAGDDDEQQNEGEALNQTDNGQNQQNQGTNQQNQDVNQQNQDDNQQNQDANQQNQDDNQQNQNDNQQNQDDNQQNQNDNQDELTSCQLDEDCPEGEVCAFVATDDELVTACKPDNDGAEAGEECDDHDDCRSRGCNDAGFCSAPCDDDDRCGRWQLCEEETFAKGDQQDQFEMCVEMPVVECDATVDCVYDDTACNIALGDDVDDLEGLYCGVTNPGESPMGSSCTEAEDCESNLCWESWDGTTGECTEFCEETDRDCADDQVCVDMVQLGACLGACKSNEDCDGGNRCQYQYDQDEEQFNQFCAHPVGDGEIGEDCDDNTDCETGFCLGQFVYGNSGVECNDDSDCDAVGDDLECRCPPGDSGCDADEKHCITEEPTEETTACSQLCDPTEGDDHCEPDDDDDHDLVRCADNIEVTSAGGDQLGTIAGCTTPLD